MTRESLTKLASDARVAGMLAGKPGIVHLHTGSGKDPLKIIFDVLNASEIPISTFRPTHLAPKYEEALKFAARGGYVDFTCDPDDMYNRSGLFCRALEEVPEGLMTISTDSNGSLPVWNEKNEMIGISAASISALHQTVKAMVQMHGCPLEKAIKPATENVAKALKLYPAKGVLAAGADADIVLLDEELEINSVYARGKCMMQDGEMKVRANFEF